jgi:hypothetical protein
MPKRGRRKKRDAQALSVAAVVGVLLGVALAALQLQETVPKWSQIPEILFTIADLVAVILVTAALTERVRTALLCGVIAAASQFLSLLAVFAYSYGIAVALAVVPFQSLRMLTYPAAGVIGGYIGYRIATAGTVESSRHGRRIDR